MNAIKTAERWGVSVDVARDRAKIIPMAEKKITHWEIPDNIDCPPITSHMALVLMQLLSAHNEGAKPNYSRVGIRLCEIEEGYEYLTDCGYITGRPGNVTQFGKKLMEELEKKPKTKTKIATDGVGVEIEN